MPNWIKNVVHIQSPDVIKNIVVKDHGNDLFDFQKIIPMPEELDETSDRYIDKLPIADRLVFLDEHNNIDNWYDWCIRNWGTKWNSDDTHVLNDKEVVFCTAWSTPFPIFKELSKQYHTTVSVAYADEGNVDNSGMISYKDGEEIYYKEGNRELYDNVWNT